MDRGAWQATQSVGYQSLTTTTATSLIPELMITQQNNSSYSRAHFSLSSILMTIQQQCILLEDMFLLN